MYRSVVWTEACPSKNWICSNSPPAWWQRRAHDLRRSCGPIRCKVHFRGGVALQRAKQTFLKYLGPKAFQIDIRNGRADLERRPAVSQQSSSVFTQDEIGLSGCALLCLSSPRQPADLLCVGGVRIVSSANSRGRRPHPSWPISRYSRKISSRFRPTICLRRNQC
jgi:hypothetical protein